MTSKKQSAMLHRSRQAIPFQRRQHLHDGLRMMPADIPRESGWLIQRPATNLLIEEADEKEAALYNGESLLSCTAMRNVI
jgi:hypothetical protein